jgi:hypothetical protein
LGSKLKRHKFEEKRIETPDIKLLHHIFPSELMDYFLVNGFYMLCSLDSKKEFWLIEFEEKNQLPESYSAIDYESKGFMESKFIQDFPLRGKGVFLSIKKRRWRHKQHGNIIKRDFSFLADGSKFTQELSDFLKDGGQYATRYHEQHSELLRD